MKKKVFVVFCIIILFVGVSAAGVGSGIAMASSNNSPDIAKAVEDYSPIVSTAIYDSRGDLIDTIGKERRIIATIDEIPKSLQYAYVAIEDKNFFKHHGFDITRMAKAIIVDVVTMKKAQGASTITQQLARNAFDFIGFKKTVSRKLQEAMFAIEIEKRYTKEEILEKYLNEIYFGSGANGVKTAARTFFNKEVKDLTLAESAFLAGISNSPVRYNPFEHFDNAKKRQELVLLMMKKNNFITDTEYKKALKTKITIVKSNAKVYRAPSFMTIIYKDLMSRFDEKTINEGGLKIYTSLDVKMQRAAEDAINTNSYLVSSKSLEAGLIAIDSSNGYVKAVVGGKNFIFGNFNRATMSKRLPGSSFKPFIYYSVLQEKNYPMNMIIQDSYIKVGNWTPENYEGTYQGNVTMVEALEKSINTVAVKLLQKIDMDNLSKVAKTAGITSPVPKDLTAALGTITLSPYELAKAYIPFSNGGYTVEPVFITKIEDKYGNVIFENKIKKEKVFDPENVSEIVHLMRNAVKNGTGKRAYVGIEQAGKTGTTNDFTNAWFAGFTPDLVTTLYVGNDNNKPMGKGMSGGSVAAPIYGAFMSKVLSTAKYKPGRFEFIDDLVENKDLTYVNVDIKNGLVADETSPDSREALLKREFIPMENAKKYRNGITPLLN